MTYYIDIENTGLDSQTKVVAMARMMSDDGHDVMAVAPGFSTNACTCPVSEDAWLAYLDRADAVAEIIGKVRDFDKMRHSGVDTYWN